jgi:fructokinase
MEKERKVLGFGAVLWDDIPDESQCPDANSVAGEKNIGGSVFNVVANLHKLGFEGYMLSAIGADTLGERTFQELTRLSIHSDFIKTVAEPTCLIKVKFDSGGIPHYSSPGLVSWDMIRVSGEQVEQIKGLKIDVFVFGTLEQRNPVSRTALQKVLADAHFDVVYLDLTLRGDFYSKELLDYSMRKSDIVKMNEEEALVVNELFDFHQRDLSGLMRLIAKEFDNDIVCITLGRRGALIGDRSTTIRKPAYKITVKDTVGSGDAFSAGLLYMLSRKASLDDACDFGNRMGALISSKKSSIPEYGMSELDDIRIPLSAED